MALISEGRATRAVVASLLRHWGLEVAVTSSVEGTPRADGTCDVVLIDGFAMPEARLEEVGALYPAECVIMARSHRMPGDTLPDARRLMRPIRPRPLHERLLEVLDSHASMHLNGAQRRNGTSSYAKMARDLPLHILVAEDNAVNQVVIDRTLRRLGYEPDVVANGREALAALEQNDYDVVLMDVQMPEMDGYDATRRIRDTWGAARPWIIAMTANAMDGDRERCLQAGMDDYVPKPVQVEELRRALEEGARRDRAAAG